jgi:hypothetical protein
MYIAVRASLKCHPYSLIYMESRNNQANQQTIRYMRWVRPSHR